MKPCVFCDIPANVEQYERLLGVHHNGWPIYRVVPIDPVTKGHVLFVPHVHVENATEDPALTGKVFEEAARWAAQYDAANLITSIGSAATQSVFHLHVHVVPRVEGDGLRLPWTEQQHRLQQMRTLKSKGSGGPIHVYVEEDDAERRRRARIERVVREEFYPGSSGNPTLHEKGTW